MNNASVLAVFGIMFVTNCFICCTTGIEFNLTNVGIVTLFAIIETFIITTIAFVGEI